MLSTSEISTELKLNFIKEVKAYAIKLNAFIDGTSLNILGSKIPVQMPKENILQITDRYTKLGSTELQLKGVRKTRAQSISKYTFESLSESVMLDLENKSE